MRVLLASALMMISGLVYADQPVGEYLPVPGIYHTPPDTDNVEDQTPVRHHVHHKIEGSDNKIYGDSGGMSAAPRFRDLDPKDVPVPTTSIVGFGQGQASETQAPNNTVQIPPDVIDTLDVTQIYVKSLYDTVDSNHIEEMDKLNTIQSDIFWLFGTLIGLLILGWIANVLFFFEKTEVTNVSVKEEFIDVNEFRS